MQHELALWVKAGIPASAALQAATYNAAAALDKGDTMGTITKGKEATLIVLDGDPLVDIANLEHISSIMLRGERVNRTDLLEQDKP